VKLEDRAKGEDQKCRILVEEHQVTRSTGTAAGSYEHGNESSDSIKSKQFLV
jgi:hypothetical protein